MKGRLSLAIAAFVSFSGLMIESGEAQSDPLAPREFVAPPYQSPHAHFSYSSKIVADAPNLVTVEYAICNLEDRPLIYSWHGPNIALGRGGRLPGEQCDIARRDLCAVEHDYNTTIEYTQAARPLVASAHVSTTFCGFSSIRQIVSGMKRLAAGEDWTSPTRAVLEVEIVQTLSDEGVRHVVWWQPPTVSIALSANAFGGQAADEVTAALGAAGYEARAALLSDLVRPENWKTVEARLKETVIVLRQGAAGEGVAFETKGSPNSIVSATASVIDPDAGLLFDFEFSAFSE